MPVLAITNLKKSYGGKPIIDGLDLTVNESEISVIMGRSGSGKTTLLLCLLGFVVPEAGGIFFDREDVSLLPIEKRQIAYLPQDYGLFPHLTVNENIAFGLAVRGVDAETREKKVQDLLKIVELPAGIGKQSIGEISGGEKQRVALARALAIEPRAFLLDEPLSAIDVETKEAVGRELRALIKRLHVPAIIITHDPADARNLGDTLYHLSGGKLEKR